MQVYKIVCEFKGKLLSLNKLLEYKLGEKLVSTTPLFVFKSPASAKRFYYLNANLLYCGWQVYIAETESVHEPPSLILKYPSLFSRENLELFWKDEIVCTDMIKPPDGTVLCYDLTLKERIL